MKKVKRSYFAGQHIEFDRNGSPFLNQNNHLFSEKVPRKFMGHGGRYNFRLPNSQEANLNKIKSGCISCTDEKKMKLKLFKYQKFVSAYVDPRTPYSCLIWHSVGSGKTMTMWHIIEGYIRRWHCQSNKKQIFLISNPKQLEGFENELKIFDKISGIKTYMTKFSRSVKYGDKNRKSRYGSSIYWKRTKQDTQLILMNFAEAANYAKIVGFENSLVILDEAHNITHPSSTYKRFESKFKFLANHLSNSVSNKNVKVVPLTATPIKEGVHEMGILLNMVSKRLKFPVTKDAFLQKYEGNISKLKKDTRGLVSYFNRESDLSVQPRKQLRNTTYGNTYIQLGEHQKDTIIKNTKGKEQNKSLLRTLATFSGVRNNDVKHHCNKLDEHLNKFGPKFLAIINTIENSHNEKHWVYCGLQKRAGVKPISESLICKKWKQIKTEKVKTDATILKQVANSLSHGNSITQLPGEDYKRFVVLESTTPKQISALVLYILNHHHNVSGKLIRVIIGDSSRKEGMDLYSIKNVHIVSPEYKYSDWHQAISRAIRYCSFKYVQSIKDWNVHIFTYVSTTKQMTKPNNSNKKGIKQYEKQKMLNIDEQILKISDQNANELLPFLQAFKEGAIDCFVNANMHKIEGIKCDMKTPVVNKKKPKKSIKQISPPLIKNSEFTWIVYFSKISNGLLNEWISKCKSGKCTSMQKSALKIVTGKKWDPFSGKSHNKSIHISHFTNKSLNANTKKNPFMNK